MRLKFFAVLMSMTALILGAAFYLKHHYSDGGISPAGNLLSPTNYGIASAKTEASSAGVIFAPVAEPVIIVTNTVTPGQRRAAIDGEVERLQQLSVTPDVYALSEILNCLTNSEKEIREAAVEAAREFGDTNAIPALKAAAESTGDTREKIAFLEAADFLLLPPVTFENQPVKRTAEQIKADQQRHIQRHPDPNPPAVPGN